MNTLAIRAFGVAVTGGAAGWTYYGATPGVITAPEATFVITLGSVALVIHLTAGWASRGVKSALTGDNPRHPHRRHRHTSQSVTVSEDRHAE
jgi:hypothetical protein